MPVGGEAHEKFAFLELFDSAQEDPSTLTARKLDWESFLATQCDKAIAIVQCMAEGGTLTSLAAQLGIHPTTVAYHKERLSRAIKEFMGEDVLALAIKQPEWRNNLVAAREKHSARSCAG